MMIRLHILCAAGLAAVLTSCKPARPAAVPAAPSEMAARIQNAEGLTMVHIWATWCDPCREEFPEVVHVLQEYPELSVILVSGDDPKDLDAVNAFLLEHHSPVGSLVATELSQEFIETFSPEWAGTLPATFFYQDGRLLKEWSGKRTFEEYRETIETLLKNERSST